MVGQTKCLTLSLDTGICVNILFFLVLYAKKSDFSLTLPMQFWLPKLYHSLKKSVMSS